MFGLAYTEYITPLGPFLPWRWQLCVTIGVLAILVGIFFWVLRYFAYVQPFPTYLKLVTPFLRVNISYKRIRKTTATEMRHIFNYRNLSFWVKEIFSPLASKPALVVELSSYPVPPHILRLFLYRFFFKDKTPHLVILVEEWMRFSAELESMRAGLDLNPPTQKRERNSILNRLPGK
jgi:hypothetical protein